LALAWLGARRAAEPVMALLVVAAAGLLVSPVSWSHHWVWIAPALAYFAYRHRAVVVVTVVVFGFGHRFLPHAHKRELAWTWWQHVLGNSYLLAALAFLTWSALASRPGGSNARLTDRVRPRSASFDRPMNRELIPVKTSDHLRD
jgi:alpha-1,2-mannosyltransferase